MVCRTPHASGNTPLGKLPVETAVYIEDLSRGQRGPSANPAPIRT